MIGAVFDIKYDSEVPSVDFCPYWHGNPRVCFQFRNHVSSGQCQQKITSSAQGYMRTGMFVGRFPESFIETDSKSRQSNLAFLIFRIDYAVYNCRCQPRSFVFRHSPVLGRDSRIHIDHVKVEVKSKFCKPNGRLFSLYSNDRLLHSAKTNCLLSLDNPRSMKRGQANILSWLGHINPQFQVGTTIRGTAFKLIN